jgi:serine/threonine protein kinase
MAVTEGRTRVRRGARTVLGRYRLEERLASGGTAQVWRARDTELDRAVAVKLPHPHLLPDATSRARLAAEVRAVAALSHPGIVKVLAVRTGSRPAIVLEFVEGETLAARLERDGPMAPRDAARVGAEIAEALYHAHTRGVIHRDVKPANILLNGGDRARLVDFGIARLLGEAMERMTQPGTVVGTLRYMAPEQLHGDEVGPRTDLYGLGAVLCEVLTGHSPHSAATAVALVKAQAAGPPAMPGVDPGLRAVVRACLQSDPADRPLHAGAVAAALRAWMTGDSEPALAMASAASQEDTAVAPIAPDVSSAIVSPQAAARSATAEPEPAPAALPASRSTATPSKVRLAPRPIFLGTAAIAALLVLALVGAGQLRLPANGGAALPSITAAVTATPRPVWVAGLIDEYTTACGDSDVPTATDLLAMGREDATQFVQDRTDGCQPSKGKGKGHGQGGD